MTKSAEFYLEQVKAWETARRAKSSNVASKWDCGDCHLDGWSCVLHDHLWDKLMEQGQVRFLCVACMERRLDRGLSLEDLKCVPGNEGFFRGFQMAERELKPNI